MSAFRNCILRTSPVFKFGVFVKRQTCIISDHLPSSLRDVIQTFTRENVFHRYSLHFIFTRRFEIYRKTTYFDDHVRAVKYLICVSRVFFICLLQKNNSDILHPYRRKSIRKDMSYSTCQELRYYCAYSATYQSLRRKMTYHFNSRITRFS